MLWLRVCVSKASPRPRARQTGVQGAVVVTGQSGGTSVPDISNPGVQSLNVPIKPGFPEAWPQSLGSAISQRGSPGQPPPAQGSNCPICTENAHRGAGLLRGDRLSGLPSEMN